MAEEKFNFEEKLDELDKIIGKLESEDKDIEEQITEYEKGLELIKSCREFLNNAEQKITDLSKGD